MRNERKPKEIFDKGSVTEDKYQNGPVEDRSCTDILCCLLFLAFLGGMGYVANEGYNKGDPIRLLAPYASDGSQCGYRSAEDKPYLFMPNLIGLPTEMFKDTVCVSTCPLETDPEFSSLGVGFAYSSEPCILLNVAKMLVVNRYCLPSSEKAREEFFSNSGAEKVGQYLSDLYTARQVLLMAVGLSFVFALVYMILLRCCAKLLVWVTMIGFFVLLGVIGYFFYEKAQVTQDEGDQLNYKILALIFWGVDLVFFLAICCLYDDIQTALTIIQAAALFIFDTVGVLITPILAIIVAAVYLGYWVMTVVYIYSVGNITQYGNTPFSTVEWDDTTRNLWYYHLFGLFWGIAFLVAVLQFTIAATAAQWYFSCSSDESGSGSVCKSFYWAFRYHLGSLAFGSLILAIVMFIRFIFEYMRRKIEEGGATNKLTKCLLGCFSCLLRCIGKCIIFLTKNAYIQVAIRSTNFCSSAWKAFQLILRNVVRFALVNAFASVFTFFGKLLIGLGTAFVGWFILTSWVEVKDKLYTYIIPTIACFVIGYIFGQIFLTVYDLACSAILQCFLIDEELAQKDGIASGRHRPKILEPFFETRCKNPDEFDK